MGAWLTALEMRVPRNVLMVAMAKKLARIAWAVLSTGRITGPSRYGSCVGSRNHQDQVLPPRSAPDE